MAVRVTAARLVTCLAAIRGIPLADKLKSDFGQKPRGEFRAVGAPPSVRVFGSWRPDAQSDSFVPEWAKESRRSGGGFLKGGTVGDSLEWRSFVKCLHFAFHLDIDRKVHKQKQTDKLQF